MRLIIQNLEVKI